MSKYLEKPSKCLVFLLQNGPILTTGENFKYFCRGERRKKIQALRCYKHPPFWDIAVFSRACVNMKLLQYIFQVGNRCTTLFLA